MSKEWQDYQRLKAQGMSGKDMYLDYKLRKGTLIQPEPTVEQPPPPVEQPQSPLSRFDETMSKGASTGINMNLVGRMGLNPITDKEKTLTGTEAERFATNLVGSVPRVAVGMVDQLVSNPYEFAKGFVSAPYHAGKTLYQGVFGSDEEKAQAAEQVMQDPIMPVALAGPAMGMVAKGVTPKAYRGVDLAGMARTGKEAQRSAPIEEAPQPFSNVNLGPKQQVQVNAPRFSNVSMGEKMQVRPVSKTEPVVPELGTDVPKSGNVQSKVVPPVASVPNGYRAVLPDEVLKPGADVKMDMATGKNYVKEPPAASAQGAGKVSETPIHIWTQQDYLAPLGYKPSDVASMTAEQIGLIKRNGKMNPSYKISIGDVVTRKKDGVGGTVVQTGNGKLRVAWKEPVYQFGTNKVIGSSTKRTVLSETGVRLTKSNDVESAWKGITKQSMPDAPPSPVGKVSKPSPVKLDVPKEKGKGNGDISIGDSFRDSSMPWIQGKIVGEGTIGRNIPAWKVEYTMGPEKGTTNVLPKGSGIVKAEATSKSVKKGTPGVAGDPGSLSAVKVRPSMEPTSGAVSKQQIIDHFSRSFGIPIRTGRFKHDALGIYKVRPEVVRSRTWGQLTTIAHEVGHHIENTIYGFGGRSGITREIPQAATNELIAMGKALYGSRKPTGGYRSEGFAEFIAHHLVGNDTKSMAPTFTDWFESKFLPSQPQIAKTLSTGKGMTTQWYQQGAYNRVYSQIGAGPKNILSQVTKPWLQKQVARFKDLWTDSGATIELFEKDVRGVQKITPETVDPKSSPTQLFRADRMSATSKAISMVRDGTFDFAGKQTGPSLKSILAPVSENPKDFMVYAYARRAVDLDRRGINAGISTADANHIIGKHENPTFRKALDDLTNWQGKVLDYVVESGALSQDAKVAIEAMNPVYIPLKRVLDTEGGFGTKKLGDLPDAIKKIRGSGRPIHDPMESIIKQTAQLISLADRTRIGRSIAQLGDRKGAGKWIEEIPAPQQASKFSLEQLKGELEGAGVDLADVDLTQVVTVYQNSLKGLARENIVTFAEGGQRKFYQLEPNLYKAAMALDGVQQNLLLRILGAPARTLRMGTTGLNPEFALGVNPFRDALTFGLQSEYAKGHLGEIGRGIYRRFSQNEYRSLWERSGADMSTMIGMDRQSLRKVVGDILADDAKSKSLNVIKHPIEFAREALSFTESGPRLAEFESAYKKLSTKYGEGASARIGAVNAAKDVTTDFTRMGRYGQVANALIPFFNVAIQGPSKFARTVAAHPVRSGVFGVSFVTVPTIALWTLNKDEEWYRELPAWRKYGFWNFEAGKNEDGTPRIISLPRPFEWGLALGAGPEAYLNYQHTKDPKQINEAVGSIWDQLSPGIMPQALKVPVELWSNYDFFRDREIVPYYMNQNKPAEAQYFASTPRTYRELGKLLDYSPLKLEHAVEGVTGSITTRGLRNIESVTGLGPEEKRSQMADYPIVGRFAVRQPSPEERTERIDFQRTKLITRLKGLQKYGKTDEIDAEITHWNATYPNHQVHLADINPGKNQAITKPKPLKPIGR